MTFLKILGVLFVFYCFFVLSIYVLQRRIIFSPVTSTVKPEQVGLGDMDIVQFHTADQHTLYSWYKAAIGDKPTIVYFHGNAGHLGDRSPKIRPYLDEGYGVLLVSYRGYGPNAGIPSEKGLYNDARAAITFIRRQGISPRCTVLFGESLGSGVAIQMAKEGEYAALVLQSPYSSFVDVGYRHYPFLPVGILLKHKFMSWKKIRKIHMPVFVMHGANDTVIPLPLAEKLYSYANQPKQMEVLPGYGHNNMSVYTMAQLTFAFLEKHVKCGVTGVVE